MKNYIILFLSIICIVGCKDDFLPPPPFPKADCPNCPVITSIYPEEGFSGTTVNITGKNFDRFSEAGSVKINGVEALFNGEATSTEIEIEIPANATTGEVVLCSKNIAPLKDNILCSDEASEYDKFTFRVLDSSSFTVNPIYLGCGTINFDNQSENISNIIWDFGDSNTSNELSPQHTYSQSGIYQIHLSAEDLSGNQIDTTFAVDVSTEIFDEDIYGHGKAIGGLTLDDGRVVIITGEARVLQVNCFAPDDLSTALWKTPVELYSSLFITDAIKNTNGNIVVCGSQLWGDYLTAFFLEIDNQGRVLRKNLNLLHGHGLAQRVNRIIQLSNGGYALSGHFDDGLGYVILTENGTLKSFKHLGVVSQFRVVPCGGITELANNRLLFAGINRFYIVDLNTDRVEQYPFTSELYAGLNYNSPDILKIDETIFAVTGSVPGTTADDTGDLYIGIYTTSGELIDEQTYIGFYNGNEIKPTDDGGFVVIGSDQQQNVPLIKYNSNLKEEWVVTIERPSAVGSFEGYSVSQTEDGGYMVFSSDNTSVATITKIDCKGNL